MLSRTRLISTCLLSQPSNSKMAIAVLSAKYSQNNVQRRSAELPPQSISEEDLSQMPPVQPSSQLTSDRTGPHMHASRVTYKEKTMHDWLRPSMTHPWGRGSNIPGNKAAQRRGHMDKQTGREGQKGCLTKDSICICLNLTGLHSTCQTSYHWLRV